MGRFILVALAFLLLPGVAAAQRDPELRVGVGQEVWVGIPAGHTIHGAIEAITADGLTIGNAQRYSIDRRDILQVWVRDGVRDGAILGAIGGAGSTFLMGPLCDDGHCTAAPVVIMAVVGAGLGALLDAVTPRGWYSIGPARTSRSLPSWAVGVRPLRCSGDGTEKAR